MSRQRMRQDQQFWHIVKDLRWKLDDHNGGIPAGEPEFGYGGTRSFPAWSTHLVAFLLGGIAFGLSLAAPATFVPMIALGGVLGFVLLRARQRR